MNNPVSRGGETGDEDGIYRDVPHFRSVARLSTCYFYLSTCYFLSSRTAKHEVHGAQDAQPRPNEVHTERLFHVEQSKRYENR